VIAFNKEFSLNKDIKTGIKELVDALLDDPLPAGTVLRDLHSNHISEIIKHIIYHEKYDKVNFTVSLEADGYHLKVKINKKGMHK
jgi:hypothetical protein